MRNRNGQSTAEYAIVISVVVAAVIGMQLYVKRGLNAKIKTAADALGSVNGAIGNSGGPNLGVMNQYEPYYTESNYTTEQNSSTNETMALGGRFGKNNINENTTRRGNQNQGVNVNAGNAWR